MTQLPSVFIHRHSEKGRWSGIHQPVWTIHHFHISYNALYLPPKFCVSIIFNFSWDGCNTQEKWKTKVVQNLGGGGQIRCIMGNVEVAYRVDCVPGQQARLRQPDWMNEGMNDTNNLSFTTDGSKSCTCYLHHAMHKVQLLLNPSTIDGHGEGA